MESAFGIGLMKVKVKIEDMCDGFSITIDNPAEGPPVYVHIDQEDDRSSLKQVFEALGAQVEYEEVC